MSYQDTTDEEFIRALREISESYPDRIYRSIPGNGCRYVHDGCPSCLIGHVMHRLGVPLDELECWEGVNVAIVVKRMMPGISPSLRKSLMKIQARQDSGLPWLQAVGIFL